MKRKYKITLIALTVLIILAILFGKILIIQVYNHLAFSPKRPLSVKEKKFIDSLKTVCNCNEIFRYPENERDFFKPNSEYIIYINLYNSDINIKDEKDNVNLMALQIAQKSYREINNRDTTIFTRYGVIFWGNNRIEFHYKAKDLE